MVGASFRFDIGTFQCMVISDGFIVVPGPSPQDSKVSPEESPCQMMDVSCLFVSNGQRKILIDTGCGNDCKTSAGHLAQNLQKEGISPADIDTIIYTHGHFDHIGGTFDAAGKPVYPRARHVVSRKEWECWVRGPEKGQNPHMFDMVQENFLPIPDQFDLAEDNSEVITGIRLIPAFGHTLGSVMVQISSGKDTLLCIGDLIHSQIEFSRPEYFSFLDSDPGEAIRLRTEGLSALAASGTLVFACHMPFPGIGYFVQKGDILGWQPVQGG